MKKIMLFLFIFIFFTLFLTVGWFAYTHSTKKASPQKKRVNSTKQVIEPQKPTNICIIIASEKYGNHPDLPGVREDVHAIYRKFQGVLGYKVYSTYNLQDASTHSLSLERAEKFLADIPNLLAKETPSDIKIFVVGHGLEKKFITSDLQNLYYKKIFETFNAEHLPTYSQKTKTFYMSVCRGNLTLKGRKVKINEKIVRRNPHQHIAIIRGTAPGYSLGMEHEKEEGSFFVNAFFNKKFFSSQKSLLKIFEETKARTEKASSYRESPSLQMTFPKPVRLFPKGAPKTQKGDMHNPYILLIGASEYALNVPYIPKYSKAVHQDIKTTMKFFEDLGYEVRTNYILDNKETHSVDRDDLEDFLEEEKAHLLHNNDYDGILVMVYGAGTSQGSLVDSEGSTVDVTDTIIRNFTRKSLPLFIELPKIFVLNLFGSEGNIPTTIIEGKPVVKNHHLKVLWGVPIGYKQADRMGKKSGSFFIEAMCENNPDFDQRSFHEQFYILNDVTSERTRHRECITLEDG